MTEQDYERLVDRLAQRDENVILGAAIRIVEEYGRDDADEATQRAHDLIFEALIQEARWERVEAADISDIAWDAANRAWSQRVSWEED